MKINNSGLVESNNSLVYYSVGDLISVVPESGMTLFPLNITSSRITGIAESDFEFRIYPVPVSDELVIESEANGEFDIRDLFGRKVYISNFPSKVNMAQFDAGIYIVSLYRGSHLVKRHRIIKK
ncbi:MAG: T9SS type A sorting domain-containing protein [Cyclobacteriaceae bacterium]|nr:T9SS type A sorting domain-containing protein [Cyclobacteriaceae bacterium]